MEIFQGKSPPSKKERKRKEKEEKRRAKEEARRSKGRATPSPPPKEGLVLPDDCIHVEITEEMAKAATAMEATRRS